MVPWVWAAHGAKEIFFFGKKTCAERRVRHGLYRARGGAHGRYQLPPGRNPPHDCGSIPNVHKDEEYKFSVVRECAYAEHMFGICLDFIEAARIHLDPPCISAHGFGNSAAEILAHAVFLGPGD